MIATTFLFYFQNIPQIMMSKETGIVYFHIVCLHLTVFSIDYSDKLDLLVSGSADETVKLWRLSDGSHITTLTGHSDWVIQV